MNLKYYNSTLKIGFNYIRDGVYCCNTNSWLKPKVHAGRLVFGNKRIPYTEIKKKIDKKDYKVEVELPF
mgnify:CR=1 FL=1